MILIPGHAVCLACGRITPVRNFLLFGDELEPKVVLKADSVNVVDHVVQHQTLSGSSHANHHDDLGRLDVALSFSKCEMTKVMLCVLKRIIFWYFVCIYLQSDQMMSVVASSQK